MVDHGVSHLGLSVDEPVPTVGFGGKLGHHHPQVLFEANQRGVEFGVVNLGSGQTDECLGLVDSAVGDGKGRILRHPASKEKASGAVVAFARVDLHGRQPTDAHVTVTCQGTGACRLAR